MMWLLQCFLIETFDNVENEKRQLTKKNWDSDLLIVNKSFCKCEEIAIDDVWCDDRTCKKLMLWLANWIAFHN